MQISLLDPLAFTPPYDHHLAAALAARGHAVELVTSRFLFGEVPAAQGYRRRESFLPLTSRLFARAPRARARLLTKAFEYPLGTRALLRRVARQQPDVVHAQWLPWPRVDLRWLRQLKGTVPLVLTAHDVIPRRSEHQIELWRQIFDLVDAVVVHSSRAVTQLVEHGVDQQKVVRILHPIFAPKLEPAPQLPTGSQLLFFGLIRNYKGLDLLIRALPKIAEAVPNVCLHVAGDPVDPVRPVQLLAAELGVEQRISWQLEFVADRQIPELMRQSAAVVLPYRKIDSSGVLATALGHGRACIVSNVGSLGDIVSEFGCGLVVERGSVEELAEACVRLLTEPSLRQSTFDGTVRAAEALTWEQSAAQHEAVYEAVRQGRDPAAPVARSAANPRTDR